VPAHQRWMNEGKFDGGKLSADEKALRDYYVKVMNISAYHPAMQGNYASINSSDIQSNLDVTKNLLAFTRWKNASRLLVVSNFNNTQSAQLNLSLSAAIIGGMGLDDETYIGVDLLTTDSYTLSVEHGTGRLNLTLAPLQSVVINL